MPKNVQKKPPIIYLNCLIMGGKEEEEIEKWEEELEEGEGELGRGRKLSSARLSPHYFPS